MVPTDQECSSGKTSYQTLNQAKAAGIKCAKGSRKFRAYYCQECGRYHLTTQTHQGSVTYSRTDSNRNWKRSIKNITIDRDDNPEDTRMRKIKMTTL